jgi:hypothetical protein
MLFGFVEVNMNSTLPTIIESRSNKTQRPKEFQPKFKSSMLRVPIAANTFVKQAIFMEEINN